MPSRDQVNKSLCLYCSKVSVLNIIKCVLHIIHNNTLLFTLGLDVTVYIILICTSITIINKKDVELLHEKEQKQDHVGFAVTP